MVPYSWSETMFGVPQDSILGPLLFYILMCGIFYFSTTLILTIMLMTLSRTVRVKTLILVLDIHTA